MPFSPSRSDNEYLELIALYDIGATGAHTLNCGGAGIVSVTRASAGVYNVNVAPAVAPVGPLIGFDVVHFPVAGAGPKNVRPTKTAPSTNRPQNGSASANGVCSYESWSVGTTPAQVELESGCQVSIRLTFLKNKTMQPSG